MERPAVPHPLKVKRQVSGGVAPHLTRGFGAISLLPAAFKMPQHGVAKPALKRSDLRVAACLQVAFMAQEGFAEAVSGHALVSSDQVCLWLLRDWHQPP
jgi:hypothetical protein